MSNMHEWEQLVQTMELPVTRKHGLIENARWFIRNGAIANSDHPNFEAAMSLAKTVTRYGSFTDKDYCV